MAARTRVEIDQSGPTSPALTHGRRRLACQRDGRGGSMGRRRRGGWHEREGKARRDAIASSFIIVTFSV